MFAYRIQIIFASLFCFASILKADFPFEEAWQVDFDVTATCLGSTWLDENNVRHFLVGATNRAYIISEGEITWESPDLPGVVTVIKRFDFGVGDGPELVLSTVDNRLGIIHMFSGNEYDEHISRTLFSSESRNQDGGFSFYWSGKLITFIDIIDSNLPDSLKRVFIGNVEISRRSGPTSSESQTGGKIHVYSFESLRGLRSYDSGIVVQSIPFQSDDGNIIILGTTSHSSEYEMYDPPDHGEASIKIRRMDSDGQTRSGRTIAQYDGEDRDPKEITDFFCFQKMDRNDGNPSLFIHYRNNSRNYLGNFRLPYFGTMDLIEIQREYSDLFVYQQADGGEQRYYLLGLRGRIIDVYDVDDLRLINQFRIEPRDAVEILFDNFDDDDEYEMAYLSAGALTYYDLGPLGVESDNEFIPVPSVTILNPAYPNPFNGMVTIPYQLSSRDEVTIKVFDLYGREVTQLYQGVNTQGNHQITWSPEGIPSGTYMVRVGLAKSVSMVPVSLIK